MNKADLVKEWFEIASTEHKAATHLFETMQKKPLEIICYLCQQSTEKSLKGFLANHDIEPPYTHDLESLRLMCIEKEGSFEVIQEACIRLREYASTTRYPDRPEILESDALYALNEAKKIYSFCADFIPALKQEREQEA